MASLRNQRVWEKFPAAFFIFLAISLIYFSKAFVRKEIIAPWDSWLYYYPLKLFYFATYFKHGLYTWNPYEFLGVPFFATLQTAMLYPFHFIYFILPTPVAFNLLLILHYALAGYFTYLYLRLLDCGKLPSFLAGIVFSFSGFLISNKPFPPIQNAAVWIPLLLYLCEKIRRELNWKYSVLAAWALAMQLFAGGFQISVYTILLLFLFALYHGWKIPRMKKVKFAWLTILPVVLGMILALPQLVTTRELSLQAWRVGLGYGFFTDCSFPPWMLPTFISPFIFGDGYGGRYWGSCDLTELCGFIGIFPLALALWIVARSWKQNTHVRFFAISAALSLLLAMGGYTPISKFAIHIPIYNLFRVPARQMVLFDFSAVCLFAFGLNSLLAVDKVQRKKVLLAGMSIVLLCLGGLGMFYYNYHFVWSHEGRFSFAAPSDPPDHYRVWLPVNPAIWIPECFCLVYLLWLFLIYRFPLRRRALGLFLFFIVLGEAASFGMFIQSSWPSVEDVKEVHRSPLFGFLRKNLGRDRYAVATSRILPQYNVPEGLASLNGYEPLVNKELSKLLGMTGYAMPANWSAMIKNNLILSALNVRFLVLEKKDAASAGIEQVRRSNQPLYRKVFEMGDFFVFENHGVLPKVFSVTRLAGAENTEEVLERFNSRGFDPGETALVSARDLHRIHDPTFSKGKVSLLDYGTNQIKIETAFPSSGFVVVSDQYDPGWKAFVDGRGVSVFRIDGCLRGIPIPQGHHTVVLRYLPSQILLFSAISLLVFCGSLLALRFSTN